MRACGARSLCCRGLLAAAILLLLDRTGSPIVPVLRAQTDESRLPVPQYPLIAERLAKGEAADALRLVADEARTGATIELRLLRARALADAGRYEDALPAWREIGGDEASLADFARSRLFQAAIAGRLLASIDDDPLPDGQASAEDLDLALDVATAAAADSLHDRAIALSRRVLERQREGPQADRARLQLVASLDALGRPGEALDVAREAVLRFRVAFTFTRARRELASLGKRVGTPPPTYLEGDYALLADRLAGQSRFDEALEMLREWRDRYPATTRGDAIDAATVTTLYNARRNAEARRGAQRFLDRHATSRERDQMRLILFRLAVREGNLTESRERGNTLWRGTPPPTASVRYAAGSLLASSLMAHGDVKEALPLFAELYRIATDLADKRSMLLRLSVAALGADETQRAVNNLQALIKLAPEGDAAPAAAYLLGVAQWRNQQRADAVGTMTDVAERWGGHYYGLRAEAALDAWSREADVASLVASRRSRSADTASSNGSLLNARSKGLPEYRAAVILARAGFAKDAARSARRAVTRAGGDETLALLAARASADAGEYRQAVAVTMTHFRAAIERRTTGLPPDVWLLAYPRPYWEEIRTAAAGNSVDPVLMLALMRRESRFDAEARSAVGALGLFQIMPYTATEIGPSLGLKDTGESRLFDPGTNATIAAGLLRRLTRIYGDRLTALIASYNAGEDRVSDWLKFSGRLPDDLFVELIPYAETRGFVREVFTNYQTYKRLYGS